MINTNEQRNGAMELVTGKQSFECTRIIKKVKSNSRTFIDMCWQLQLVFRN